MFDKIDILKALLWATVEPLGRLQFFPGHHNFERWLRVRGCEVSCTKCNAMGLQLATLLGLPPNLENRYFKKCCVLKNCTLCGMVCQKCLTMGYVSYVTTILSHSNANLSSLSRCCMAAILVIHKLSGIFPLVVSTFRTLLLLTCFITRSLKSAFF
jgi:hypothetical protein